MTDLERLAIDAIAASPYPYDRSAPVAEVVKQFKRHTLAILQECVESGGPDPLCSKALLEPSDRFSRVARLQLTMAANTRGDLVDMAEPRWPGLVYVSTYTLLKLLRVAGLVTDACMEQAIETTTDPSQPKFMQRARVYGFLAEDDVEAAKPAAESSHLHDSNWIAWRAIGEYHAERGNAAAFLTLWSTFDGRRQRERLDWMRQSLVEGVSRHHGWQEALNVAKHRRIATRKNSGLMLKTALEPLTETMTAKELEELISSASECEDLPEIQRLLLLVEAMLAHPCEDTPDADHPELANILERIIAVDPTFSKEQSHLRDFTLSSTWPLIGEENTLKRMRSAIRSPTLRHEYMGLKKDAVRGSAKQ